MVKRAKSEPNEGISAVCLNYYEVKSRQTCFEDVGTLQPAQGIITICKSFYENKDKLKCYKEIGEKSRVYDPAAEKVCANFYEAIDRLNCAKKLAGLEFNSAAAQACLKYYENSSKLACLIKIGKPARHGHSGKHNIVTNLENAIRLIDSGKFSEARSSIEEILEELKENK